MTATPGYAADLLNALYIVLTLAIAVFVHKLFRTRPLGVIGDVAVAALGIALFAFYLRQGWMRMLVELDDAYPSYFALAYMPIVAFVSTGFLRSIAQLVPGPAVQPVTAAQTPPLPKQRVATPPAMPMTMASPGAGGGSTPASVATEIPVQKPPSRLMKALKVGVGLVLVLVFALIVLGKFVTRNDLPDCEARQTTDVLSTLFKAQNLDVKRYAGFTTRATDKDLITCTAALTLMDNSNKALDYEISRLDGGRFQVKLEALRDK